MIEATEENGCVLYNKEQGQGVSLSVYRYLDCGSKDLYKTYLKSNLLRFSGRILEVDFFCKEDSLGIPVELHTEYVYRVHILEVLPIAFPKKGNHSLTMNVNDSNLCKKVLIRVIEDKLNDKTWAAKLRDLWGITC